MQGTLLYLQGDGLDYLTTFFNFNYSSLFLIIHGLGVGQELKMGHVKSEDEEKLLAAWRQDKPWIKLVPTLCTYQLLGTQFHS